MSSPVIRKFRDLQGRSLVEIRVGESVLDFSVLLRKLCHHPSSTIHPSFPKSALCFSPHLVLSFRTLLPLFTLSGKKNNFYSNLVSVRLGPSRKKKRNVPRCLLTKTPQGQPYDWFNLDDMGDLIHSEDFASTLKEVRYPSNTALSTGVWWCETRGEALKGAVRSWLGFCMFCCF